MSALWCCVALVAWVVLPGIATAAVVCRGPEVGRHRCACLSVAMSSGLIVWFLGSELLARLDLMSTTGAVVATAVVAVMSLVVIVGPVAAGCSTLRSDPVLSELAIMLRRVGRRGAAAAGRWSAKRTDSLSGPTPWYYLDLARAVIQAPRRARDVTRVGHPPAVPRRLPGVHVRAPPCSSRSAVPSRWRPRRPSGSSRSSRSVPARTCSLARSARLAPPLRCPWSCCSSGRPTSASSLRIGRRPRGMRSSSSRGRWPSSGSTIVATSISCS